MWRRNRTGNLSSKSLLLPSLAGLAGLGAVLLSQPASASLVLTGAVGASPMAGMTYENFNGLSLGGATQTTASGITVSFTGDGAVFQGSTSQWAAPYLSNNQGALFGDANGVDTTHYVSSGIGASTFQLPVAQTYLGFLWGSVDLYNTLMVYSGATLLGSFTGAALNPSANGDRGANGTYYVSLTSTIPFDRIVASSTQYAFEIDDMAFSSTGPGPNIVPEPAALSILGLGLAGLGLCGFRQKARRHRA